MYAPFMTGVILGLILGALSTAFVICALIRAKQSEIELGE